jgi:capsule polysaccharide export protein KpsC/LpsZ
MIDMLSKLVPEGWKIYVKEHPSQFKDYQAAERAKPIQFYNMITSMPKVEFVPLTYTSFELIDNAQASATVSGTVGWESVVRGKPTLLFGHSWYQDCKGVFVTHTVEDCKNAIQKIKNGYKVNMNEVKCFARVVENCSVKGYTTKWYAKMDIISNEENVENLARAIHEFIS